MIILTTYALDMSLRSYSIQRRLQPGIGNGSGHNTIDVTWYNEKEIASTGIRRTAVRIENV
ncbi:17688_t:CDS:2, partial [Gigaspora rosea]